MKKILAPLLMLTAALSLSSCSWYMQEKRLDNVSLFMSKEETTDRMSSSGIARGAMINKHGQSIEVLEYKLKNWGSTNWSDFENTYWFYFCEGKLVQWGRAGDWAEAQKMIYDINFNLNVES